MPLVYHGYTFEEMVEAVKEAEKLREEVSCLETKFKFYKRAYNKKKDELNELSEKMHILEDDYSMLDDANANLIRKYDELVSRVLDAVCDCSNM